MSGRDSDPLRSWPDRAPVQNGPAAPASFQQLFEFAQPGSKLVLTGPCPTRVALSATRAFERESPAIRQPFR